MFTAIWRFLVYRLAGGRILLAITVLNWIRGRIAARRIAREQGMPPPAPYRSPRRETS